MVKPRSDVEGLERYHRILSGEALPRHAFLRAIPVTIPLDSTTPELWEEHQRVMAIFRDLLNSDDVKQMTPLDVDNLLTLKIEICKRILQSCILCEKRCGVDRTNGELGYCRCGFESRVSSRFIHMHEEPELVPSLTVFFNGCNASCCFCQNWDISQDPFGGIILTGQEIARGLDDYHGIGIKNVNWVGGEPTPHIHIILSSLLHSKSNLPVVWNSNMYLSEESMEILSGVVDIYLADFKFGNDLCAIRYSGLERYWETVTRNHILATNDAEIMVRHLVLPGNIDCCSRPILEWIAKTLGPRTRVNLMGQYHPAGISERYPELRRRLKQGELSTLEHYAQGLGMDNRV